MKNDGKAILWATFNWELTSGNCFLFNRVNYFEKRKNSVISLVQCTVGSIPSFNYARLFRFLKRKLDRKAIKPILCLSIERKSITCWCAPAYIIILLSSVANSLEKLNEEIFSNGTSRHEQLVVYTVQLVNHYMSSWNLLLEFRACHVRRRIHHAQLPILQSKQWRHTVALQFWFARRTDG